MNHLKKLFCSIFLTTVALVAGSANALTFVTDDEAALQTRLTQAQIDNARAEGRTEADKAKIALLEQKERAAVQRAVFAERRVASERQAKHKAQHAAKQAKWQLASLKAKHGKPGKAKKSRRTS